MLAQTAQISNAHKPKLVPLDLDHLSILRYILARIQRHDLYSISPSYFALTGRKGLWIYGDEGRGMLIARHPNDPEKLLFFPPFGSNSIDLIETALKDSDLPKGAIQIVRLSQEDETLINYFRLHKIHAEQEKKLDWRYDVHVLNINSVLSHKGHKFKDFRNNLNKTKRYNLRSTVLDIEKHDVLIRDIILKWATDHESNDFSIEDMIMPTRTALYLKRSSALPIQGIIIFEDHNPVSFILWEETRPKTGLTNGLCNANISQSKGISEYTYFEMCRILKQRGYHQVCVGGSEEIGLDRFKRKMNPEHSVSLQTINLR